MSSLTTYREAVLAGAASLKKCNADSPEYDAKQLLLCAAGMNETQYLLRSTEVMTEAQAQIFDGYIRRRMLREPLQHIIGTAPFYGRLFTVSPDVLVPRFDTEVLVENVLKVLSDGDTVLDMCTGSGCIIITLALERRLKNAVGCDISDKALRIAQKNWNDLKSADSQEVKFFEGDLFESLNSDYRSSFTCIVSNPPYIRNSEIDTLSDEVRRFEPHSALDGGDDGLDFYRRITREAPDYLTGKGYIFYEIGYEQAKDVSDIMEQAGFRGITVVKDLAGLDRGVYGHL